MDLGFGGEVAAEHGITNLTWLLGADTDDLDLGHLVGSLYSALPVQRLPPPDQRPAFAEQVRHAVAPHERFTEPVRVRMLLGRAGQT